MKSNVTCHVYPLLVVYLVCVGKKIDTPLLNVIFSVFTRHLDPKTEVTFPFPKNQRRVKRDEGPRVSEGRPDSDDKCVTSTLTLLGCPSLKGNHDYVLPCTVAR